MGYGLENAGGLASAQAGLRQRLMDQIRQRKDEQDMQIQLREQALREQEAQQRSELLKQGQADRLENQRGIAEDRQDREAMTAFTMMPRGTTIAPRIAGRMRNIGLPVTETPGITALAQGQAGQDVSTPLTPDSFQRGATQADQDRQTAITVGQQARQETIDARAEQAGQQRDLQLQIARMGDATRRDVAAGRQADAQAKAEDKKSSADTEKKAKRQAAMRATDDTLDALNELLDVQTDASGKEVYNLKPGVSQLYGARIPGLSMIPGTDTANALASMNRLRGRMVTDLLGELKAQSRTGATGFGALSEKELGILQSSASKLENSSMSDQDVMAELRRIRERLLRVKEEPGTSGDETPEVRRARIRKAAGL